jgi:hypothetical protein
MKNVKEVEELTISLLVNEKYSEEGVNDIVSDIQEIIGMTDSDDIKWEYGSGRIVWNRELIR